MDEDIELLKEQLKRARKGKRRWKRKAIRALQVNHGERLTKWNDENQCYLLNNYVTVADAIKLLGKYEDVLNDKKRTKTSEDQLGCINERSCEASE